MSFRLACLLAPQRNTQYAELVARLAWPELQLSPLGALIEGAESRTFAGLPFLVVTLRERPDEDQMACLGALAMTCGYFWLEEGTADRSGPWLHPIEVPAPAGLPTTLLYARRYKGKTNESLTRFLINLARFASDFAQAPGALDILDPLCGGGTTLFAGLAAGHNVYGIDHARHEVIATAGFLRSFLTEAGIPYEVQEERLRRRGRRWTFTIDGPAGRQVCGLAHGDTADAPALFPGLRPHLIVGDLPYGIQHKGAVVELLAVGLPVWAQMLRPGGGLALAWDATRLSRAELLAAVRPMAPELAFLDDPPWNELGHAVDRVIKRRDVLAARRRGPRAT